MSDAASKPAPGEPELPPERRAGAPVVGIGALYFTYFTYVGLFSPYLALYLAGIGLTIGQIGLLMAVPQGLRIVGPPVWGWLADRSGDSTALLRVSSAGACLAALALAFSGWNGWAGGAWLGQSPTLRFWLLFGVLAALFFSTAAQMPIAETMAMRAVGGDTGRYGRLRVWGSVGFIIGVVGIGPVLDAQGVGGLPWWVAGLLAVLTVVAFRLPAVPAPARSQGSASIRSRFAEPRVRAFFASAFLMMFAHAVLYAFFSLYLAAQGYSKTAIGIVWAIGVVAEIVVFWVQRGLFERFGAPRLLRVSLAVAAIRFMAIGLSAGWLPAIIVAQLAHAITFGVHHSASIATLQAWFEPAQQARAQALYVTIGYGLGGSAGVLVASEVWGAISPGASFVVSGLAAAIGWWVLRASTGFGQNPGDAHNRN